MYKIDKDLYNEFKKYDNDKFEDELYEVIRFRSGSKKTCLINDKVTKYSESKNNILKLWLKTCLNNSEDNINNLIDTINKYQICFGQNSYSYLKDALTFLIAGKNKNDQKKLHKYLTNKKTINSIIDLFPKTKEEILDRCILRVIKGSEKDYLNLTHQHLNWLPYFYIDSKDNKVKIFDEYKSLIKQIIENKEKLISIFKNNNYIKPKEFISILDIENIKFIEHNEEIKSIYLDEYGSKEKLNKILNLFILNNYISEDQMRLTVNKFIQNSKHIQGICNAPTFYEFIISLSVMFKVLPNLFDKNADEFTQVIRKSLNLTFSNKNLIPQRFAAGGRPDAIIETSKGSIIVEPTLQIYRQTKAEADSIADHMNKFVEDNENVNLINTLFVSPKIEKRIISTFDGWYEDKIIYNKVETFNQKNFIKYINNLKI